MKKLSFLIITLLFSTMIFSQVKIKPDSLCQGFEASFSPDGKYIAFRLDGNIWILNLETKAKKKITTLEWDVMPSWSPDGKSIVFQSWGTSEISPHYFSIWVVDINGSNQHQFYPKAEGPVDDSNPFWSPDGKRIAWTHGTRLWIADSDGKNAKPLTKDPARELEDILDWSRDSKTILYKRYDFFDEENKGSQICTVDTNSQNQKRIELLQGAASAKYAEDSKSLYFSKFDNCISKYDLATQEILENIIIIDIDEVITTYRFSPDFKSLTFTYQDIGDDYVYIMKIK
jgi:Tol biopolymer transport system component